MLSSPTAPTDELAPRCEWSSAPACAPASLGIMLVPGNLSASGQPLVLASTIPAPVTWLGMGLLAVIMVTLLATFVLVPLFKGVGWGITNIFRGIGWLVRHLFRFVSGMLGDVVRAVGSLITAVFMVPLILGNVVIGRWSAASHYGSAVKDEFGALGHCIYRVLIGHPAKLLLLGGLTEGIERRIPQAMQAAPGADKPSGKSGQFDGYTIVGSLPIGGSGGKLYVAEPSKAKLAAFARAGLGEPKQVVIKSFSLADGSTMPQIVRESRALEAARKLGLIYDHELTDSRFYYAMPYVPGDNLTVVTKRLHAEAGVDGLRGQPLAAALSYTADLLTELDTYHRGGLWHKDVKPDNIIVAAGKANLIDFGLVTPLRSSMTLTTHGTEYFRDPELVRMALRGAKVNEVDGVKFDIYGAGAVLYSIIENSFPAHGALSQISRACPEALRWVVRRSMADMNQRYATSAEMLADVRTILVAPDPFALKPIDLPSMGGAAAASIPNLEPVVEHVSFARSTPPPIPAEAAVGEMPPVKSFPIGGGHDFVFGARIGVGAAAAATTHDTLAGYGAPAAGPATTAARQRPRVRLTDWWTGRYAVDGQSSFDANAAQGRSPRVQPIGRMPRGPGRTAAEQLQSAQDRVRRVQDRVRGRRYPTMPMYKNDPNGGVAFAVVIGALAIAAFFTLGGKKNGLFSFHTQSSPTQQIVLDGHELHVDGIAEDIVASIEDSSVDGSEAGAEDAPSPHDGVLIAREHVRNAVRSHSASAAQAGADFERKLNSFVNDIEGRIQARMKDGKINYKDYGIAIGETMKAWLGDRGKTAPVPPEAPTPPPAIEMTGLAPLSPVEPGAGTAGEILIVSFLPPVAQPSGDSRAEVDRIVQDLKSHGVKVRGLANTPEDIDLVAQAKGRIGLAGTDDADVREQLRDWITDEVHADALLWIPAGGGDAWRLISSAATSEDVMATIIRAIKK